MRAILFLIIALLGVGFYLINEDKVEDVTVGSSKKVEDVAVDSSEKTEDKPPLMTPMTGVRTAPPVELPDSNGQAFNMEDYKGKYILVNFWAHWCGPCVKEFPAMQTLYDALKEDGFEIIAVHAGPPQGRVRPFLKKHNITFKTVLDADMSAHGWDVPVLPVSYLINPEGKLVYKALGPRDWEIESMRALMTEK